MATEDERCRRLRQIPGFGPLVSTALVAALATAQRFVADAVSQPGLALCPGSIPLEVNRNCSI